LECSEKQKRKQTFVSESFGATTFTFYTGREGKSCVVFVTKVTKLAKHVFAEESKYPLNLTVVFCFVIILL